MISALRREANKSNLTALFRQFERIDNRIEQLEIPKIAFTVRDLERYDGFRGYDVVPFNNVVFNIGGHFSSAKHSFVCPVHGIYVFHVTFITAKDFIDNLELRKNNARVIDVWAYYYDSHYYGSGSVSIVLECFKHDDVRVVTGRSGSILANDFKHVFSGFLLNKL